MHEKTAEFVKPHKVIAASNCIKENHPQYVVFH